MTHLAASIVRLWVRLYTAGLETAVRERIRQEVEADLWEQIDNNDTSGRPITEAVTIFLRWILGIPADVQRMVEEPVSATLQGFAKGMRWAARIIVVCEIAFFFLLAVVAFGFGAGADGIVACVTLLTGVASCIISWRRERVAGVLLIFTSFGLVASAILMYGLTNAFWPWSVRGSGLPLFGSPLLIAGVLFLLSWRFSRRPAPSELFPSINS